MTNQIENENKEPLIGELDCPVERMHIFTTHSALCDFVKVFNINNYNVRYGQSASGKMVHQLVYQVVDN